VLTYQNPALLALAQGKLAGLVGKPSGYINSLPTSVRRRIDGLKGIQAEHSKVESEFQLAILDLEKKVNSTNVFMFMDKETDKVVPW
jgi:nucleosome assembly protein 1-like 1